MSMPKSLSPHDPAAPSDWVAWGCSLAVVVMMILGLFSNRVCPPSSGLEDLKGLLLTSKDTLQSSSEEDRVNRIKTLREDLIRGQEAALQREIANVNVRVQYRSIYAVILAGLLATGFIGSSDKRDAKDLRSLLKGAIVIVGLMYMLDVSYLDLMRRAPPVEKLREWSLETLSQVRPEDSLSISVDTVEANEFFQSQSRTAPLRKLEFATIRPDLEQDIFYLAPLAWMLFTLSRTERRGIPKVRTGGG